MTTEGIQQVGRRGFLGALIASGMGLVGWLLGRGRRVHAGMHLRPPGALMGDDFLDACVRCFKCGDACPNDCIKFYSVFDGFDRTFTPYLKARERGCILCGECADVCPSGALQPFTADREGWIEGVSMGTARVNEAMCFSFNRRTCGACYRACPLAGEAMTIGVFETPYVHPEACVGCGLCEQACLHLPQAIRVVPKRA